MGMLALLGILCLLYVSVVFEMAIVWVRGSRFLLLVGRCLFGCEGYDVFYCLLEGRF